MRLVHAIGAIALLLPSYGALAGDKASCDAVLVKTVASMGQSSKVDWRMASLLDKETYDNIKRSNGFNAVIYGVPVGNSYEEFRANFNKMRTMTSETFRQEDVSSWSYEGVAQGALDAFVKCQEIQSRSDVGIHLFVNRMTEREATVVVKWTNPRGDADNAELKWVLPQSFMSSPLPDKLSVNGEATIVVARPESGSMAVAVNSENGYTDDVAIPGPVPPPRIPPRPEVPFKFEERTFQVGVRSTGRDWPVTFDDCFVPQSFGGTFEIDQGVKPKQTGNAGSVAFAITKESPQRICVRADAFLTPSGGNSGGNWEIRVIEKIKNPKYTGTDLFEYIRNGIYFK